MNKNLWLAGAIIWGFAEATVFFIVPDILLTAAVLTFGFAMALRFAAAAAIAAAIGGAVMLRWGASDAEAARAFLLAIPLIGDDLLIRVQSEIGAAWPLNLMRGAITGAPYKIYAVEAGAAHIHALAFAAMSVPARFARFALLMGLFAGGQALLQKFGKGAWAPWLLAAAWMLIYAVYTVIRAGAAT